MTIPWSSLALIAAVAACGFPTLPRLADATGDDGDDGDDNAGPITLELLAGDANGAGSVDGLGPVARFNSPQAIAADLNGNLYVADSGNGTIRKITPAGAVTTVAGAVGTSGSTDGMGAAARFGQSGGIAFGAGVVYIADSSNHTIRALSASGVVSTFAGTAGMPDGVDGVGPAARFRTPKGLAVGSDGAIYVADSANHAIRKITQDGAVTTLAGLLGTQGDADGTGADARFESPLGVAVDASSNVYVADSGNEAIRKVTPAGVVTTLVSNVGLQRPIGIVVENDGTLYFAEQSRHVVRKRAPDGKLSVLAGTVGMRGSADGLADAARFYFPAGLARGADGTLYVADGRNSVIRAIAGSGSVTTLAGTASLIGSADGTGAVARFSTPAGVSADATGNVYVADASNHTLRKITPAGAVTTLAGLAGVPGSADGVGELARLNLPFGAAVDSEGDIYITDEGNSTVRKVTPDGTVTTLAGTAGMSDDIDGTGAAARFRDVVGAAVDRAGNVYVADFNSTVRKITPAGVVTTLAGTANMTGGIDGTGAEARFNAPAGVAVDGDGNLYVADFSNHTIRKVTADGVVTTLAGTPGMSGMQDGMGPAARFANPIGVALDATGNVYVAENGNGGIRKVTQAGVTTTIVGTPGLTGIALGATPRLAQPMALWIMGDSLLITDANAVLILRHGAR